jgi:hypothetical protein
MRLAPRRDVRVRVGLGRSTHWRSRARLLGLRSPPNAAASVVHTGRGRRRPQPSTDAKHSTKQVATVCKTIQAVQADLPPPCGGGLSASRASMPPVRLGPPPLMKEPSTRPTFAMRGCRRARLHRAPGLEGELHRHHLDRARPVAPQSLHSHVHPPVLRSLDLPQGGAQPQRRSQHIAA